MKNKLDFDHKKVKYALREDGKFIIDNYNFSKPFSSFFPGIAGLYGIPMWVFYVNRGQAISSFGTSSKDQPILEFEPANKTYQMVFQRGFRTFIKIRDKNKMIYYEPFQNSISNCEFNLRNQMVISPAQLELEEQNSVLGLNIKINYFTIPSDNFAALVRVLSIQNNSKAKSLELIDGLPIMIPYGLSNMFLKKLARTIEAWMGVENLENRAPYYRLKVDPTDRPEVIRIKKGNFYLSFYQNSKETSIVEPIVDPECVFGRIGDLSFPYLFLKDKDFKYPAQQIIQSKTPSALSFVKINLKKNQEFKLYSIFGNMESIEKLNENMGRIAEAKYLKEKQRENSQIIASVMKNAFTMSSFNAFNNYVEQTFLDNVIRGGLSITLNNKNNETIYVYSRKHGDLERDYNKFLTQPTYFSQGNGNYRDINQNRRNDVYFNTELKDANIIDFFNLIQLDGFNPLVIKGISYHIEDYKKIDTLLKDFLGERDKNILSAFLSKPFYIGQLFMFLEENNIKIKGNKDDFVREVLSFSIKQQEAEHKEGFWTDHWVYNIDLLENYLSVYPENLKEILLDKREFTFFDDYFIVNPRHKKYVLYNNKPRQLNAVVICQEKKALIEERQTEPNKVRTDYGRGKIYTTNLMAKLICIIVNKLASFDPFGVGIEMEANKPNWYDALNGLPALFGSSISETMELKRLILFIKESIQGLRLARDYKINIAEEIFYFYSGIKSLLNNNTQNSDFKYWDESYSLKEEYRKQVIFGLSGKEKKIEISGLFDFLDAALVKIEKAIAKSYNAKDNTYSTYFINEVIDFQRLEGKNGCVYIKPLRFMQRQLPLFLEGFVHALRIIDNIDEKKRIYNSLKKGELYDRALGMYKVNAPLVNQPEEIGRAKAFTPGWLENESIWLHMEYKYLLELLKSKLYEEFYQEFFKVLVAFNDPQRYGRSILENSSFIVSSAFTDKKLHGNGFVARLSGSTSELINIWLLMNLGKNPFFLDDKGKLCLEFKPALCKELFTKKKTKLGCFFNQNKEITIDKDSYSFNLFGNTLVVYHNPKRLDTYGKSAAKVKKIILKDRQAKRYDIDSNFIPSKYASDVRLGKVARIDVFLS